MKKIVVDYLKSLELGDIQVHKNVAVASLSGRNTDNGLEYLLFDEALCNGLSVKETQIVSRLNFSNNTGKRVLVLQGEYIKGGSQNRMVSRNLYLEKEFSGEVPVNCVQRLRWDMKVANLEFVTSKKMSPISARGASNFGQGAVWRQVSQYAASNFVRSHTEDLDELYSKVEEEKLSDINEYKDKFSYKPNSVGIIVATNDKNKTSYHIDVFDQPSTMEKMFEKLVESYVIGSLTEGNDLQNTIDLHIDLGMHLNKIENIEFIPRDAISLGQDYRLHAEGIEGSSLTYENTPLYTSFATYEDNQKETTGIIR